MRVLVVCICIRVPVFCRYPYIARLYPYVGVYVRYVSGMLLVSVWVPHVSYVSYVVF